MEIEVEVFLLSILLCCSFGSGQDTDPISHEYTVEQGGAITLNCSQSGSPDIDTWWNVTWVLPNLTLIKRDLSGPYKVDFETTFTISHDGQLLLVENLQPNWYGEYYCMVLFGPAFEFYVSRFGLNTSYYYNTVMWEEYQHLLIVLGVASGTILALLTLLFSLIIWCKKRRVPAANPRPDSQAEYGINHKRRAPEIGSGGGGTVKNSSVWEEYLGPSLVFPITEKPV